MQIDHDELVAEMEAELGDALRPVATYESQSYEMHYFREDVEADYTEAELARLYEPVEIEGMGYEHFQKHFHTGNLECAIYGFEPALMVHFPWDPFAGLFVSIDRDVELNPQGVIDSCPSMVDQE